MYRGTTPTLVFKIDTMLDLTTVTDVWVTIRAVGYRFTYKVSENTAVIDAENSEVKVSLTQEDTLKYLTVPGKAQLKFLTDTDKVFASPIIDITVNDILNEDIMSNE